MSNLPILNMGFKTQESERKPHFLLEVENWYAEVLAKEKTGSRLGDKTLSDDFLRKFYPESSYKAKVVARQEGCLVIEVFRWLEFLRKAQANHLWVISLGGIDYIKLP